MSLQHQFSTHNLSELPTSSASVIETTNSLSTRSQRYLRTRSLATASVKEAKVLFWRRDENCRAINKKLF